MRVLTTATISSQTMASQTMTSQTMTSQTTQIRNARRIAMLLIVLTIAGTAVGVWA